jgi:putative membrane protein (TIGR04086 family)
VAVNRIEWPAVRAGALAGIMWCVPAALLASVLAGDGEGDTPAIVLVLYVVVLLGLAFGGWVAARRSTESPYTSGAFAALVAFVAIQAVGIVTNALRDDAVSIAGIVFNGLLAYGCGLLGAAVVVRERGAQA